MKKKIAFFLIFLTISMNMITAYASSVSTPSEVPEDMELDETESVDMDEIDDAYPDISEGVVSMDMPSDISLDDYVNYRYDTFSPEDLEEMQTASPASLMMEDIPTAYSDEVTGDMSPVSIIADLLMDSGMKISKATAQGLYDELRSWISAYRFSKEMTTFTYVALSGQIKAESLRPIELKEVSDFLEEKKSSSASSSVPCALSPAVKMFLSNYETYFKPRVWYESNCTKTLPSAVDFTKYSFDFWGSGSSRNYIYHIYTDKMPVCGKGGTNDSSHPISTFGVGDLLAPSIDMVTNYVSSYCLVKYKYDKTSQKYEYDSFSTSGISSVNGASLGIPVFNNLTSAVAYSCGGVFSELNAGLFIPPNGFMIDNLVRLGSNDRFINWQGSYDVDEKLVSPSGFGALNNDSMIDFDYDIFDGYYGFYKNISLKSLIKDSFSSSQLEKILSYDKGLSFYQSDYPAGTFAVGRSTFNDSYNVEYNAVCCYSIDSYDPTHVYKLYCNDSHVVCAYDVTSKSKRSVVKYGVGISNSGKTGSINKTYSGISLPSSLDTTFPVFYFYKIHPSFSDVLESTSGGITGEGTKPGEGTETKPGEGTGTKPGEGTGTGDTSVLSGTMEKILTVVESINKTLDPVGSTFQSSIASAVSSALGLDSKFSNLISSVDSIPMAVAKAVADSLDLGAITDVLNAIDIDVGSMVTTFPAYLSDIRDGVDIIPETLAGIKALITDIPSTLVGIKDDVVSIPAKIADAMTRAEADAKAQAKAEAVENVQDKYKVKSQFKMKFPFCIPFDLVHCVSTFTATQTAPRWEIPFVIEGIGIHETIVVDLSGVEWQNLTFLVRVFVLLFYIMGLIILTRNLIKG